MIPSRPLFLGDIINEAFKMSWKTLLHVSIVALLLSAASTFIYVWGVTDIVEKSYSVLQKNYPLDSASVAQYRSGALKEIKEENPLLLALYFPDLVLKVDQPKTNVVDTIISDSTYTDSLHTSVDSIVTVVDMRSYLSEAGDFFYDNSEALFGIFDAIFFASLFAIFISIFLGTFIIDICVRFFEERKLNVVAALTSTFRRNVWMSILMYLLMIFILLFGFGAMVGIATIMPTLVGVLLIFGAMGMLILTGVRLIFAQVTLVSEELGPWESLHRSWTLTKGYFWRTVGIFIVLFLIFIVVQTIAQAIVGIFDTTSTEAIKGFVNGEHTNLKAVFEELNTLILSYFIQSLIITVLFITFTPSLLTVMYYDLRTRKDGPLTYPEDSPSETVLP